MVRFSQDVDILRYEPVLFGELHLPWQVLCSGSGGSLSGTKFTADGADFVSAQVEAGGVIYLWSDDGLLDGPYEIVSVDSASELTVSVVRAYSQETAVAPPAASAVYYRIGTFAPQAEEVGFALTQYLGVGPGDPASGLAAEDILEPELLRRLSVYGVLANVYAMWAGAEREDRYWQKHRYWRQMYERARQRCRVRLDVGGDGVADVVRLGGCGRLVRG